MELRSLADWFATVIGMAAVLAVLVVALVEGTKRVTEDWVAPRFYPVFAVFWGIMVALFISVFNLYPMAPHLAAFVGLISGLMAAGLFKKGKDIEVRNEIDDYNRDMAAMTMEEMDRRLRAQPANAPAPLSMVPPGGVPPASP